MSNVFSRGQESSRNSGFDDRFSCTILAGTTDYSGEFTCQLQIEVGEVNTHLKFGFE